MISSHLGPLNPDLASIVVDGVEVSDLGIYSP